MTQFWEMPLLRMLSCVLAWSCLCLGGCDSSEKEGVSKTGASDQNGSADPTETRVEINKVFSEDPEGRAKLFQEWVSQEFAGVDDPFFRGLRRLEADGQLPQGGLMLLAALALTYDIKISEKAGIIDEFYPPKYQGSAHTGLILKSDPEELEQYAQILEQKGPGRVRAKIVGAFAHRKLELESVADTVSWIEALPFPEDAGSAWSMVESRIKQQSFPKEDLEFLMGRSNQSSLDHELQRQLDEYNKSSP